mmetsp:Transcript_10775/g.40311  ORF Transcript_10775/g.40311 Transcript_10775/m.40311 type:complete len:88 (+) Transcript_10775:347-610(+)
MPHLNMKRRISCRTTALNNRMLYLEHCLMKQRAWVLQVSGMSHQSTCLVIRQFTIIFPESLLNTPPKRGFLNLREFQSDSDRKEFTP